MNNNIIFKLFCITLFESNSELRNEIQETREKWLKRFHLSFVNIFDRFKEFAL